MSAYTGLLAEVAEGVYHAGVWGKNDVIDFDDIDLGKV